VATVFLCNKAVYIANIIHLFTIAVAAMVAFVAFKLVQLLIRTTPSSGGK
jgi:hypothetical protein